MYTDIPGVFVDKVGNHEVYKKQILEAIKNFGVYSLINDRDNIANTDFHIRADWAKPIQYWEILAHPLTAYIDKLKTYVYGDLEPTWQIMNFWFQQYYKESTHNWHTHSNSMYNSVYYVELPEDGPGTTFFFSGQEVSIPVKEGDILSFPSFLAHTSSPNRSELRKTVVAFNSSIEIG